MRQAVCSMTADAVVVAARADGSVDLEFQPLRTCGACAGTCLWKRLQAARIDALRVAGRFEPGTRVQVALPERRVLAASLLVHGLPLAAILIGAAAGAAVGGSDVGTLAGALTGLAIAIAMFRPVGRRLERATLSRLVVSSKP